LNGVGTGALPLQICTNDSRQLVKKEVLAEVNPREPHQSYFQVPLVQQFIEQEILEQ
jgi:hypothetical protein